ncbi:MAG: phosphoglycerate dehydrogenase [Leptospiraceae bacterium]|nr:phosphoglycerate dehydrogenase [Leptospiraceae bacterium]
MAHKIIICDKFDAEGVKRIQEHPDLECVYNGGYKREELLPLLADVDGLIIRSATTVDKEILEQSPNLKLVVRAGVGVDNIDIPEASRRGVIVMNAPGGNSVSTAEQALALLFALARKTPQANASMKESAWEKKKFKGVELTGKTIGVAGLGRIGKEVVKRARGLGMRVIGFDPYIPRENLADLEIQIVDKDTILRESDFITVHTPLTDTTRDFISSENLKQLKDGVYLVNCARGGIYNEAALVEGLESGKLGGVALDVFSAEPPPAEFPLRNFENCIMTPHLGASTGDAEFAVAMETVDELIDFFARGTARNALNFPSIDPDAMEFLKPYFKGGERFGKMLAAMCAGNVTVIDINYHGEIAAYMTQPVTTAILRGVLGLALGNDTVNYVNAPFLARDRGIKVNENADKDGKGFSSFVEISLKNQDGQSFTLKYTSFRQEPRAFNFMGLALEFIPSGIHLVVSNRDVPRVIGTIGTFLADQNVNIASMDLGRTEKGGTAHSIVTVDELLPQDALDAFRGLDHIDNVVQVDLRD